MLNKNQRLVIGVTMPCILWQKHSTGSGRGLCPHMRSGGSSKLGAPSRWDWAGGPKAPPLPAAAPAVPSLPPPLPRLHPKTPARLPAPLSPGLGRLKCRR